MSANCSQENKTNIYQEPDALNNIYLQHTAVYLMETCFMPVWILIGLPGAILSFSIWSRRTKQHPPCLFLSALALIDTVFFPSNLLYYLNAHHHIPTINNQVMCSLFPFLNIFLQYSPPMLTLGFTAQRYLSICHPFFTLPSEFSFTLSCCVSLLLLCVLIALPKLYFFQFGPTSSSSRKECTLNYLISTNNYTSSHQLTLQHAIYRYEFATEILCFVIVPTVILLLNIRVIVELILLSQKTSGNTKQNIPPPQQQQHKQKQGANTTMLLLVSFYLLLATLPASVFQIMKFDNLPINNCLTNDEIATDPEWQRHFLQVYIRVVADLISKTYYAAKFYIYIATSKWFRTQLVHQLSCCLIVIGCRHKSQATNQNRELFDTIGRSTTPRQPRMIYNKRSNSSCDNSNHVSSTQPLIMLQVMVKDENHTNTSTIDNSINSNKSRDSVGFIE